MYSLVAFKHESKQNPNYGKATGLGAEKWWGNVSDLEHTCMSLAIDIDVLVKAFEPCLSNCESMIIHLTPP